MRMYPNFKQFADKDVTITHTEAAATGPHVAAVEWFKGT